MNYPNWILKDPISSHVPDEFQFLPRIVKQLLLTRREWQSKSLELFLKPQLKTLTDPFIIGEMETAVTRLLAAVDSGEPVTLFGDYDVDGITSITLLSRLLKAYGVDAHRVIPIRGKEGYGLTETAVERVMVEAPETSLLVCMDCGTSSVSEIASLKERGLDVIVLDHHEPNTDVRPDCVAVVNPKACFTPTQDGVDLSYLCAAGVVFKVCHAMLKRRMLDNMDLKDLLDLVAIATVADIVPMQGENRILVKNGLRALGTTNKPGLIALKEVAGVAESPDVSDIGYKIGPRLNAAGRMDSPLEALEVMTTDSQETADRLVERLNRYNMDRQNYEKKILLEAIKMVENKGLNKWHCIVIGQRGWHPGVVGIVASRLMRRYFKPVFVIAINDEGIGKGSGRSINDISLVEAIEAGREFIQAGGGHHAAAGITLHESELENFQKAVNTYFQTNTTAQQRAPKLELDAEVDFSELSFTFLESYEQLKPFGPTNPQPIFMSSKVSFARPPRELKNNHLKLSLVQNGVTQDAIYFGGGALDLPPLPWDISYTVDKNVFRNRTSLQITIQHVRAAQ